MENSGKQASNRQNNDENVENLRFSSFFLDKFEIFYQTQFFSNSMDQNLSFDVSNASLKFI